MSALGVLAVGFGILTVWAALDMTNVFDILRTFIGAPAPQRNSDGSLTSSTVAAGTKKA